MLRLPLAAVRRCAKTIGGQQAMVPRRNFSAAFPAANWARFTSAAQDFEEALDGVAREERGSERTRDKGPDQATQRERVAPKTSVKQVDLDLLTTEDLLGLPLVSRARKAFSSRGGSRHWRLVSEFVTMTDHPGTSRRYRSTPPVGFVFSTFNFPEHKDMPKFLEQLASNLGRENEMPNVHIFMDSIRQRIEIGLPIVVGMHHQPGPSETPLTLPEPTNRYIRELRNLFRLEKQTELSGENRERKQELEEELRRRLVAHGFTPEVSALARELDRIWKLVRGQSEARNNNPNRPKAKKQNDDHVSPTKTHFADRLRAVLEEPLGSERKATKESDEVSTPTAETFVNPDGNQKGPETEADAREPIEERTPVYIPSHEESRVKDP